MRRRLLALPFLALFLPAGGSAAEIPPALDRPAVLPSGPGLDAVERAGLAASDPEQRGGDLLLAALFFAIVFALLLHYDEGPR